MMSSGGEWPMVVLVVPGCRHTTLIVLRLDVWTRRHWLRSSLVELVDSYLILLVKEFRGGLAKGRHDAPGRG